MHKTSDLVGLKEDLTMRHKEYVLSILTEILVSFLSGCRVSFPATLCCTLKPSSQHKPPLTLVYLPARSHSAIYRFQCWQCLFDIGDRELVVECAPLIDVIIVCPPTMLGIAL